MSPVFLWGGSQGQQPLEDPKYLTVNNNRREICWFHTKMGQSKRGDTVTPPGQQLYQKQKKFPVFLNL